MASHVFKIKRITEATEKYTNNYCPLVVKLQVPSYSKRDRKFHGKATGNTYFQKWDRKVSDTTLSDDTQPMRKSSAACSYFGSPPDSDEKISGGYDSWDDPEYTRM